MVPKPPEGEGCKKELKAKTPSPREGLENRQTILRAREILKYRGEEERAPRVISAGVVAGPVGEKLTRRSKGGCIW